MAGHSGLEARRQDYAAAICHDAGVGHERVEAAFATIPREDFLTPPPWIVFAPGGSVEERTSDPAALYRDVLVALDPSQGINNGQPSLHAAWLAAVDPQAGETALHIGAGSGYYTALLAALVGPQGQVHAYEIDLALAEVARANLAAFDQVVVHAKSGLRADLSPADVIYVNAGIVAPDPGWLRALAIDGRLVFPWQPSPSTGVTMLVRRHTGGFEARASMLVGFIACVGQGATTREPLPENAVANTRSVWLNETRAPDDTATAIYERLWFSSEVVVP